MSNKYSKARRAKVRNKVYRPKPVRNSMLVASSLVLAPLEAMLDQIEVKGTVDVDGNGNPVFRDGDGEWYGAAGGIEGLVWHLEMHETRHHVELPLDGMRELVIAFRYCAPVQPSTMRKVREAMPIVSKALAMADRDDQIDLLQQTKIKDVMERMA